MADARRLATIMSVDVAGYSHVAEVDEGAATEALARLRAALSDITGANDGRIFNSAGDGFMLEFASAVSGVAAAHALLARVREQALPRVRVGVHLGDVIVADNGDLLGHGVNVAARLMQMAEPNTAVISQAVQAQLHQASEVTLRRLGRVQLDKMSERVEVFALAAPGTRFGRISRRQRQRATWVVGGLALAILVAVFGAVGWRFLSPAPEQTPRLAVLRFENVGDTEGYFAEGVADEFISEASRVDGLDVIARASSFSLTGERATPANAAHELGATLVLTGAVRRNDESLRVYAALAEAPSGRQIWTRTFERPVADSDRLQRDIAVNVARAVGLRTAEKSSRRVDPAAYDLYLHGLDLWNARIGYNLSGPRDLFLAATTRDPNFSRAWAWLARTEAEVVRYQTPVASGAVTRTSFAPALAYAERAITLDSASPMPYEAREAVFTYLGEWRAAEAAGRDVESHGGDSYVLHVPTGQNRAAANSLRRATILDPLNDRLFAQLAWNCGLVHDWECADQASARSLELNEGQQSAVWYRFLFQLRSGDRNAARRTLGEHAPAWRRYETESPFYSRHFLATLLGDEPRDPSSHFLSAYARHDLPLDDTIRMLAQLGYTHEAAQLLQHWDATDRIYLYELYEPGLEALRRTPEFWATMEREGLVQYWRETGHRPDFCSAEPVCAQYLRQ